MINIQIVVHMKSMEHMGHKNIEERMSIMVQHMIKLMEQLELQHYSLVVMHMILEQHKMIF